MEAKSLRARDIMRTDVKTIGKNVTLFEAANMMKNLGVSSLVVEPDGDWDAFGIVTRKDVVEALIEDPTGRPVHVVGDVMSKPAITVNMALSVYNCHFLMRTVAIRRLLVVEGGKLVGILSNSDIFQTLVKVNQRKSKRARVD